MTRRILTILSLVFLSFSLVRGQDLPAPLIKAMGEGDAKAVSAYFHQNLEMNILDNSQECSKAQGTRILENFFKSHKPSSFTISFTGNKEDSRYAIGTLKTSDGQYRVNLYFMSRDNRQLIYYLSVEKETRYEIFP